MLRLNHVSYQKMYILFIMMNNFPRKEDARNSVSQYRLLNIFYNREKEIEMLCQLEAEEREIIQNEEEQNSFDITVQKRLKMIKEHWKNLIMFHFVEGAPATNNAIENYYSTSLKTHRKKQFRTDMGIINQLQLSSMKRAGMFNEIKPTLIERFMAFIPFIPFINF